MGFSPGIYVITSMPSGYDAGGSRSTLEETLPGDNPAVRIVLSFADEGT